MGPGEVERAARRAADVVRAGGVLLYPTETVYGLGCDPARAEAVARVRAIKGRDADKPMLALTDGWARVALWVEGVTGVHRRLMAAEPPLPLTLVFAASASAPAALVSAEGTVALRRTPDPFCRALVAAAGTAVLSTSANRAGFPPAHRFGDLDPAVCGVVDLAVDAGRALGGTPSTVARVGAGGRIEVLREGAVDGAALEALARGEGGRRTGEEA